MVPFIMPTRNESLVYYEQILDVSESLRFVADWNSKHTAKISVFHLILYGLGRGLKERPGLDRFVSGGRIYQRKRTHLSFAVKKEFKDEAPLSTVKLEVHEGESFDEMVGRVHAIVGEGRSDIDRPVDKEMKLLLRLPGFLLRFLVWAVRVLDRWNLMPAALMKNDPMYASIFVANLGSIGVDRVFHHLYEYGTVSLFCAIGAIKKVPQVTDDGSIVARQVVSLRYAFDERINDGHYCVASLDIVRRVVEGPKEALAAA